MRHERISPSKLNKRFKTLKAAKIFRYKRLPPDRPQIKIWLNLEVRAFIPQYGDFFVHGSCENLSKFYKISV